VTFCDGRRIVRPGAAVADRGEVFGYTIERVVAVTGHEAVGPPTRRPQRGSDVGTNCFTWSVDDSVHWAAVLASINFAAQALASW